MTRLQREAGLVSRMRDAVLDAHPSAWVMKVHGGPYQSAGVPDLLLVLRGRFGALEAKARAPGESLEHALGRVTARQHAQLVALRQAGASVAVGTSVDDALALADVLNEGGAQLRALPLDDEGPLVHIDTAGGRP